MAWLEKRGNLYRIKFRHGGRNVSHPLRTGNSKEAESCLARFEENFRLFERGRLELPPGADLATFLLTDGKLNHRPIAEKATTLAELFDDYLTRHPEGAKEETTRCTEKIHIKHMKRILGEKTLLSAITSATLQTYVEARSRESSKVRKKPISHITIRKELATLSSIWCQWGMPQGLVKMEPPTRRLIYQKSKQKLPFQTWEQITRQISRNKLTKDQIAGMWESLFLTKQEIEDLLDFVQDHSDEPFVFPMFVFAAHTGARRSEMMRSELDDVDFASGMVLIREKKKDRSKDMTFRSIPMSALLERTLRNWYADHPGGRFTFCQRADVKLTAARTSQHFRRVLDGSKWEVLSGYHALRHSFCSNLAASSVDQRIIDSFMGHQTEAMRLRYRHLFPERQQEAIKATFG